MVIVYGLDNTVEEIKDKAIISNVMLMMFSFKFDL